MSLKRILILLFSVGLLIMAQETYAIPAHPKPKKVMLSDGTQLTVRTYGDENYHYTVTTDGYTVVTNEDGEYCYAVLGNDGYLVSSKVKARDVNFRTSQEKAFVSGLQRGIQSQLSLQTGMVRAQESNMVRLKRLANLRETNNNPVLASVKQDKALVLLVNFSDVKFSTTATPKESIYRMLNEEGYNYNDAVGSARDYFKFNSNGMYDVEFDVEGPYTISGNMAYYGSNDFNGNDSNPDVMVKEVCKMAADAGVDFTKYAVDGKVPNLIIIYAGYGEADSDNKPNTIWPHEWSLSAASGSSLKLQGVTIDTYACSQEINYLSDDLNGINVVCHEFAHVLGLPDFYDTNAYMNGTGMGLLSTSLMDEGGYVRNGDVPPSFNAVERNLAGWLTYTDVTDNGMLTLEPVYGGNAYRILTKKTDEYFVLEYRNGTHNKWDEFFATGDESMNVSSGEGMIIYHFDRSTNRVAGGMTAQTLWERNMVNAYSDYQCMSFISSDKALTVPYPTATELDRIVYPGRNNVTAINDSSTPGFVTFDTKGTGARISQIQLSPGNFVTFNVEVSVAAAFSESQNAIAVKILPLNNDYDLTVVYNKTGETEKNTLTIKGFSMFNITGLEPDTFYDIELSDSTIGFTHSAQVKTAEVAVNGIPRINMDKTYALANSPVILFDVVNIPVDVKGVKWAVDSAEPTETAYKQLAAGEHTIKCYITNADDSVDTIVKYIVVQ